MKDFIEKNKESLYKTLKELCLIPAPSHFEHERAEYCKNWLEAVGAKGVYIDDALNVVFPINCDGSDKITVFVAHTDTVFPDREPMPYIDDGTYIRSPGVGDDTASVAVLLHIAKYFVELEGKVDALVLTAGVGENGSEFRSMLMNKLACLGIKIDEEVNGKIAAFKDIHEGVISTNDSNVRVEVVPTNEELMIAIDTYELIG